MSKRLHLLSIAPSKQLILASTSPRRKELLSLCGLKFEVIPSYFEEDGVTASSPKELVELLSYEKARKVSENYPHSYVVGADTIVVLDDEILGKPKDREDACKMLERMQGRDHLVWGAFTILHGPERVTVSTLTKVFFESLSRAEIEAYVDTGEPMDKAGAYGAQGPAGSFVSRIEGSFTNVVGLALSEFVLTLKRMGIVTCG